MVTLPLVIVRREKKNTTMLSRSEIPGIVGKLFFDAKLWVLIMSGELNLKFSSNKCCQVLNLTVCLLGPMIYMFMLMFSN